MEASQLRRIAPVILALSLGGLGGALAFSLNLPLAWMIGAMLATTTAALVGAPVRMVGGLRTIMVAVLGVMLGSSFEPAMIERLARWSLSLSALVVYTVVAGLAALWVLRRLARYDPVTAYFAAMPGGLSEMIMVGSAMGGDERVISLSHAARILIVVMIIPFAFRFFYPAAATSASVGFGAVGSATDMAILVACGLVGFLAARAIRVPAAAVVGPMVLSGAVHLAGWTSVGPPVQLSAIAQVVVGSAIGCRFAGAELRMVAIAVRNALAATAVLLAVTLVTAARPCAHRSALCQPGVGLLPRWSGGDEPDRLGTGYRSGVRRHAPCGADFPRGGSRAAGLSYLAPARAGLISRANSPNAPCQEWEGVDGTGSV
jgi:membrane AbrB-like protein